MMNNNTASLTMNSSNSGHPAMSTFSSNPLSLNPQLTMNNNSNRGSMNTISSNMGSGIDISQLQSIPSYHPQQNKSSSLLFPFLIPHL